MTACICPGSTAALKNSISNNRFFSGPDDMGFEKLYWKKGYIGKRCDLSRINIQVADKLLVNRIENGLIPENFQSKIVEFCRFESDNPVP